MGTVINTYFMRPLWGLNGITLAKTSKIFLTLKYTKYPIPHDLLRCCIFFPLSFSSSSLSWFSFISSSSWSSSSNSPSLPSSFYSCPPPIIIIITYWFISTHANPIPPDFQSTFIVMSLGKIRKSTLMGSLLFAIQLPGWHGARMAISHISALLLHLLLC